MHTLIIFDASTAPIRQAGGRRPSAPLCGILYGDWGGTGHSQSMHKYVLNVQIYACVFLSECVSQILFVLEMAPPMKHIDLCTGGYYNDHL